MVNSQQLFLELSANKKQRWLFYMIKRFLLSRLKEKFLQKDKCP